MIVFEKLTLLDDNKVEITGIKDYKSFTVTRTAKDKIIRLYNNEYSLQYINSCIR